MKGRNFLPNARAQLDADHFGLDKIKRRLIEYLAVIRLKEMTAERERKDELERMAVKAVDQVAAAAAAKEGENKVGICNGDKLSGTGAGDLVPGVESRRQQQQQQPTISRPELRKGVKGPILL